MNNIQHRKLQGLVVSDKMDKTVVVEIVRMKKHPKYKKFFKHTSRFKAHNPENTYHTGDKIIMEECRPLSKDKRWIVIEKVQ